MGASTPRVLLFASFLSLSLSLSFSFVLSRSVDRIILVRTYRVPLDVQSVRAIRAIISPSANKFIAVLERTSEFPARSCPLPTMSQFRGAETIKPP